jgi:hypothetical protein
MKNFITKLLKSLKISFIVEFLRRFRFFHFRLHHPYLSLQYQTAKSNGLSLVESKDLERLVDSISDEIEIIPSGQWDDIFNAYQSEALNYIKIKDYLSLENMLINPLTNDLMYGFDNLSKSLRSPFRLETITENLIAADHFVALAEYLGVINYISPEGLSNPIKRKTDIEAIINKIITKIFNTQTFSFPSPYRGEKGISTQFGIASLRVPSAIYQALRISKYGDNICEIGPGLGRTAYFATLLGIKKYTLVDIPASSLVQGYFLLASQAETKFIFNGENESDSGLHFKTPRTFLSSVERYDLVLNVDSLTEMGIDAARNYLKEITTRAKYFLSINHEENEFCMRELSTEFPQLQLVQRSRSWIRPGYVEELYKIIQ